VPPARLTTAPQRSRSNGSAGTLTRPRPAHRPGARAAAPVLVRVTRDGIEESVHRGHIVEADAEGRLIRTLGDPERVVTLRSTVKPFTLLELIEAGGLDAYDLSAAEIAVMASSHSGEDLHVRTIQAMLRRAGISQSALACGVEGMPLDALTAMRLARDGERPGDIRHMCSGQHAGMLLLARLHGWELDGYWRDEHPVQVACKTAVGRVFAIPPERLRTAIDGCGVVTYAVSLRAVASAYAMLADPAALAATDPRRPLAPALTTIRDAMLAHPELVGGTRDRLDTSLMKALPGRVVSKAGMEALRAVAILPGPRTSGPAPATGVALKIEDGDGHDRGTWAASVEALRQVGLLDGAPLRSLARYHRPPMLDPHGRLAAESVPDFELVPVGELIG
jgi:L-asparaginase II